MSDKTHNDFKALARNISFRDRSQDIVTLKLSNKHPVGSVITFNPERNLNINITDLFLFNKNAWGKFVNLLKFNWYNTSKKTSAIVCGHVVENGVAKYLVNKSVKNIFTVNKKQLLES